MASYYCPYCKRKQMLFSYAPVRSPEWKCTKCGRLFVLTPKAIAENWANTAASWSVFPAAVFWAWGLLGHRPPGKWLFALFVTIPVLTIGVAVSVYAVAYLLGLLAAGWVGRKYAHGEKRHKSVLRDEEE